MALESILGEKAPINLTPHQVTQAETRKTAADGTVTTRLPETCQWLLVPIRGTPQAPFTWQALRLSGTDALALRVSRKLRSDELYLATFASTRLRMELERIPLWHGDHMAVKQVISHLVGLVGARVTVTIEVPAEIPGGAPGNVVRTVTEKGWKLQSTSQWFEKEQR